MTTAMVTEHMYLRGKRGKWFWLSLGMVVVLYVLVGTSEFVYDRIFRMPEISTAWILGLAILYTVVHTAVWIFVPLVYALHNEIRTFRAFFIARAVIQIPFAVFYFLTSAGMSYVFPSLFEGPAIMNIYKGFFFGVTLYWVVFMIVVSCNKKTGKTLRIWAIVAAVLYFLRFLYSFFYNLIYQSLYTINEALAGAMYNPIVILVIEFLYIAPAVMILWAMSFSRMKEDAVTPVQESA